MLDEAGRSLIFTGLQVKYKPKALRTVGPDDQLMLDHLACMADDKRPILVVGAGLYLENIISLILETGHYDIKGILDPDQKIKGEWLHGFPVLGWLGEFTHINTSAVIGVPAIQGSFDRAAVFQILKKRGFHLPILKAASCRCDPDVTTRHATLLLQDSSVYSGAHIGENCLIGPRAVLTQGASIDAHSVVFAGKRIDKEESRTRSRTKPKSLEAVLASENTPIQDVIYKLNWSAMEIMLLTDNRGVMTGTVTDGDIRRGILAGIELKSSVKAIMNRNPIYVPIDTPSDKMIDIMRHNSIRQLPIVDKQKKPVGLEIIDELITKSRQLDAVIMAGGLGTRLMPLTEKTPKPLLEVAGKPILDHILSGLRRSGFEEVAISVNYLGDHIKEHVGNGSTYQLNVSYVNERDRLGTAGALSLLNPRPQKPILVMNGDLLTNLDFSKLLEFSDEGGYALVMCVKKQSIKIPYGVVDLAGSEVQSIKEKPDCEYFINAGIYLLKPFCLDLMPKGATLDMPDLVSMLIEKGERVGAFPIFEYWRDIGTVSDLDAATMEHEKTQENKSQHICDPRKTA